MKTLVFRKERLSAEKIVKTANAIYGYINNIQVFSFEGISNFSGYQLADGEEFDSEEPTLEEQITLLTSENETLRTSQAEQDALIMILILGGI